MNDKNLKEKDLLRLIRNSAAVAALLPLGLHRVDFAVYFIYVYHMFSLWNTDYPKAAFKDHLSNVAVFLSGVVGLVMLFFSPDFPLWSALFCLLLLGQIAALHAAETLRKSVSGEDARVFRIGRWALTGMNLLLCVIHIYMIAVAHSGTVQGPAAVYDAAVWMSKFMNISRLIVGVCVIVDTYRFCKAA